MARAGTHGRRDHEGDCAFLDATAACFREYLLDWNTVWAGCLRRIRTWQTPPHWSATNRLEEALALGIAAAWEAIGDFDLARDVPLSAFVHERILSRLLTRHRQEWAYALHCRAETAANGRAAPSGDATAVAETGEALQAALAALAKTDRWLITVLFWEGSTEAEVAETLGISQQAVSKRKNKILRNLRCSLTKRDEVQE
jgi:RNA polymerase sigma factor (sigma-70 family)